MPVFYSGLKDKTEKHSLVINNSMVKVKRLLIKSMYKKEKLRRKKNIKTKAGKA